MESLLHGTDAAAAETGIIMQTRRFAPVPGPGLVEAGPRRLAFAYFTA
ncbi:MAG TPA: hypothetical protein VGK74_11275 [Symbiobacteriaceae bacterium]|jgi:hypothetical protein